jgi:hypothetical protein
MLLIIYLHIQQIKSNKRRIKQYNLQPITKNEMEILIENNILRQVKGQFPDLIIVGSQHNKSHKQRFVTDPCYWSLQSLKKKLERQ